MKFMTATHNEGIKHTTNIEKHKKLHV